MDSYIHFEDRVRKLKKPIALTILISFLMITAIAPRAAAAGNSFGTPMVLGPGFNPNLQSVGNNVYVAWTDKSNGIWFTASSNNGQNFGSPIKLGNGGNYPIVSASGGFVYVVWSAGGIWFTASSDNGAHWSDPIKVSLGGAITPYIASNGGLVSVVYLVPTEGSFVTASTDGGNTWTSPHQYSNGPEPQIAISGDNIYVMADKLDRSHAQFSVSHDSGKTWQATTNLPGGSEEWIVATGSNVYAVWETKSPKSVIWFMSSTDYGKTLKTRIISGTMPDAWNPMINAIGNNVWVGIQEFGSETQNWVLTSTDGGASFSATSVSGTGHNNGFIFNIPTTDGANVYAMWIENGSKNNATVASSSDGGKTWETNSVGQSDPNKDVAIGDIAASGAHGFAVWQYNSQIYFTSS
jgi:hypothetical protein